MHKNNAKIWSLQEHTGTPKTMTYNSLFSRDEGQIFVVIYLKFPWDPKCDHMRGAIWCGWM